MLNLVRPLPVMPRIWRPASLLLLALFGLLGLLYRESFQGLISLWLGSENYAHAVIVPPMTLWLVWQRRKQLQAITPVPSLWPLPVLAGIMLVWLIGDMSTTNSLVHFSLIAAVVALVPAIMGLQTGKELIFPLFFLFFAVPFGEFLFPTMMEATADFTVMALRLSSVPVYREGMQFMIPTGNWSVIEACSGLRYLIASTMVGALFAYLNFYTLRRRLIFVAVAIVVPIVANWLRAYMIVMIGHLSSNKLAVGVDHLIYGWAFFGVVMLLMFIIGSRFADPLPAETTEPLTPVPPPVGRHASLRLVGVLAALILAAPHLVTGMLEHNASKAPPELNALSTANPAWRAVNERPGPNWEPDFLPPKGVVRQAFEASNGASVGLYIGYYRHQDNQSKLVSSENKLVRDHNEHWAQMRLGATTVEHQGGKLALNEAELRALPAVVSGERRLIVWQLFWVNGTWTNSSAKAKVYGTLYRLMGRGDDGATVVFYADKAAPEGAPAALATFVRENLPQIENQLRRARGDLPTTN